MRVAFNAFTRILFCTPAGMMEFSTNGGPDSAPEGYVPWFEVPSRATSETTIVFGHWAALGLMLKDKLVALDSGCVLGNQLYGRSVNRRLAGEACCSGRLQRLRKEVVAGAAPCEVNVAVGLAHKYRYPRQSTSWVDRASTQRDRQDAVPALLRLG